MNKLNKIKYLRDVPTHKHKIEVICNTIIKKNSINICIVRLRSS